MFINSIPLKATIFRYQLYHIFLHIVPIIFINEMASLLFPCKTVFSVTCVVATLITWANIFLGENRTGFFLPKQLEQLVFHPWEQRLKETVVFKYKINKLINPGHFLFLTF